MTPTSDIETLSKDSTITERLRKSFQDREYADAYARSALNAYIATQIKVIREQRGMTQEKLAEVAGMKQPRIAVMEDVDYSSWSISTLWRLAQAFHLRLKVSFEEFGSLPHEINTFDRQSLERTPLEDDPFIAAPVQSQNAEQLRQILAGGNAVYSALGTNVLLGYVTSLTGTENDWVSLLRRQGLIVNTSCPNYTADLLEDMELPIRQNPAISAPPIRRELPVI